MRSSTPAARAGSMTESLAILGGDELRADAMRAALERANVRVTFAALDEEAIDAMRGGSAPVVIVDAGSAKDALPWVERLRDAAVVRSILVMTAPEEDAGSVDVVEAGAH